MVVRVDDCKLRLNHFFNGLLFQPAKQVSVGAAVAPSAVPLRTGARKRWLWTCLRGTEPCWHPCCNDNAETVGVLPYPYTPVSESAVCTQLSCMQLPDACMHCH